MPESFKRVPKNARIIGQNLKYLRESRGLSQQKIARVLDISYQQVQKYEQGVNRFPVEHLYKLREFYQIPYEIFFRDFPEIWNSSAPSDPDLPGLMGVLAKLQTLKDRTLRGKIQRIVAILVADEGEAVM
ncbi:MAG: helix-turn-helix domain-containing protein [Alphaproteobacteria bacterium]|nr:helix-turn-helix domain-containing protein [Alphaproteobacteria bacterium]